MIQLRDLIGKPYSLHGRGPDSFDCYGLAIEVCKRFGKELPDRYYESLNLETKQKTISNTKVQIDAVKIDVPIPGCVVVIRLHGFESHVAVYIGDGNMIHCTHDCGVRIDTVRSYRTLIEGFYTW